MSANAITSSGAALSNMGGIIGSLPVGVCLKSDLAHRFCRRDLVRSERPLKRPVGVDDASQHQRAEA